MQTCLIVSLKRDSLKQHRLSVSTAMENGESYKWQVNAKQLTLALAVIRASSVKMCTITAGDGKFQV